MEQLLIEEANLNDQLNIEKINNYLQIIENVETELLYTAQAKDIPNLMKTKGNAILSLIELDYPYACRNDLVTIVNEGRIYSIRMDYLLSLSGSTSISLKEENRIRDMLPSLFLHRETKDETTTFMKSELKRFESLLSSIDEKPKDTKVETDITTITVASDTLKNVQKSMVKSVPLFQENDEPKGIKNIATFNIKDYCYNTFVVVLKNSDDEIVADKITITNFLVNKDEVNNGKPFKYISIVDILGNQGKHYTSVYYCFDDGKFIKAPIKLGPGRRICDLNIHYDCLESADQSINVCFDIKGNEGKKKIPSWMDIYAFPYFINENAKGGILVGKTDIAYETHASDFKNGRINLKIPNPDTGKDVQFTLFISFKDGKVVLNMLDKEKN